ncbi:MAG: CRISPR-associated endoribonuclease Cas6 [Sporolactobacillus sp.]|nr:CRISPR-associated endoribonuclease Cas6 [Sporolactobacillus sp.]
MKIKLQPWLDQDKLVVSIHYQSFLQELIYHSLGVDPSFQAFVHDRRSRFKGRRFRLFTFSWLIGRSQYDRRTRRLIFQNGATWYVDSLLPQLIRSLGAQLLTSDGVRIGQCPASVESVANVKPPIFDGGVTRIRMLSPITAYSAAEKVAGGRLTRFGGPADTVFCESVLKNCLRKYETFYGEPYEGKLDLQPLRVSGRDRVVTTFRRKNINGWKGIYRLSAEPKMATFLYAAGLGAKNSQGFGMFVPLENRDKQ